MKSKPSLAAALAACIVALATPWAHAETPEKPSQTTAEPTAEPPKKPSQTAPEPSAEQAPAAKAMKSGPLAAAAAVMPGLVIHGFGHYVAGDKKTAMRLLAWQGVGLGLMVASGSTIALTGASRYGNELTIPLLITGTGIFLNTAYADIYGSATGGRAPRYATPPEFTVTAGYGYIDDPQFDYTHFSVVSASYIRGTIGLTPSLWTALDADNQRARLPLRYRLLDNRAGDFLELGTALTYHRYGDDGFTSTVGELSIGGRINSSQLGASLAGSFSSATLGYALHRTSYDVDDVSSDTIALLIARFGYGLYLPKGGELEGYYQHRRDGYTAGLSPSPRNGSGFLGHFGIALRQPISDRFAVALRTEIGSAWVSTAGLEFRAGSTK
tara:strand:- start:79008 stop:80159 length:1152 start_codon:yes stop_codon:yes gene_type:complete